MADTAQQILVRSAHEIADWTTLWTRLLARHTPDAGGRCRACPSAMALAPVWPCRIATLASMARAVHDGGLPAAPPTYASRAMRPFVDPEDREAVRRILAADR